MVVFRMYALKAKPEKKFLTLKNLLTCPNIVAEAIDCISKIFYGEAAQIIQHDPKSWKLQHVATSEHDA